MYPLFETIKILDGNIYNLKWHQWRFEKSYKHFFSKHANYFIEDVISLPDNVKTGLFKLRFSYDLNHYELAFKPYIIKEIQSLKIIHDNTIEYTLKYSDRNHLNTLLEQRENCDEILIVKNGLITDTSFTDIILFDGEKWKTPKTPLLKGTCRERLLHEKKISEAEIKADDLYKYQLFKLINAMRDFDEAESVDVRNIC